MMRGKTCDCMSKSVYWEGYTHALTCFSALTMRRQKLGYNTKEPL